MFWCLQFNHVWALTMKLVGLSGPVYTKMMKTITWSRQLENASQSGNFWKWQTRNDNFLRVNAENWKRVPMEGVACSRWDFLKMARRELVVLAVLLSCLILLKQILMTTMADYRRLHHQGQLLFVQLACTIQRRRPKRERRQWWFWARSGWTSLWWNKFFLNGIILEEEWKENFRMSRVSFYNLSNLLRPHIERQVTIMRRPISVET